MIYRPDGCPRGRTDCAPLANLVSDLHGDAPPTFLCCGENDGTSRTVEQDIYRFCVRSNDGVDHLQNLDRYDIESQISVLAQALVMTTVEQKLRDAGIEVEK